MNAEWIAGVLFGIPPDELDEEIDGEAGILHPALGPERQERLRRRQTEAITDLAVFD